MTTVAFIRHGITAWNIGGREQGHTNTPLHEEGIITARALGKRLANEQWDAIFSSPLLRAAETARIIEKGARVSPVLLDERLSEINSGLLQGTTEQERIEKWGAHWVELDLGQEEEWAVLARCQSFLDQIVTDYPIGRLLVVSHGDILQHFFRLLAHPLPSVHNTSITLFEVTAKESKLLLSNCTSHLQ